MPIIDVVFFTATLIWIGEFFFFKNRQTTNEKDQEASSFPWILLSVISVIAISVASREMNLLHIELQLLSWIGIILYIAGISLRFWGIIRLGKQFTRNVNVIEGDTIVSSGPFRLLRHPLYTGLFVILLGVSCYSGSLLGLTIILSFFLPVLLKRISLEESMLRKAFGQDYEDWCKRRYRLIPYIY